MTPPAESPQQPQIDLARNTWRPAKPLNQLDILLLGDTAFGESYQDRRAENGKPNILHEHGYDYGFEHVQQLLAGVDLAVANLETPLTDRRESPFEGIRPYLHYGDPELTIRHLLKHNIRAVTLANNHTHDFGVPGLLDTLGALEASGIIAAGAGRDVNNARRPLRVRAELLDQDQSGRTTPFRMSMFSVFRGGRQFRDVLKAYATADQPGSASLSISALSRRIGSIRAQHPDEFVVVAPHWRRDYQWRSERQADTARELIWAGADLVLGHGSHMLQEIELVGGRWVFHGIGNFLFNSPGRYAKLGVHPYSLMARLLLTHDQRTLKLYPIVTDNRRTGYQLRPVDSIEFGEVYSLLADRTNAPEAFRAQFWTGEDDHGWHLAVHLPQGGAAPAGRSAGAAATGSSNDASRDDQPTFDPSRGVSTQLIARELAQRGIEPQWLNRNSIIADAGGMRLGYVSTDSHATGAMGVRAAQRKDHARLLLADAGLSIARGSVFDPSNGLAAASEFAQLLHKIVVKPVDGNVGRGVTVGVRGVAEFERAWHAAAEQTRRGVLVEEQYIGTEARFVVVGGRCIAAIKRIAPFVVGNGLDPVERLIELKNNQRAENPSLRKRLIKIDPHRLDVLHDQGYELTDVPPDGTRLTLDLKGNISTGGESMDITDDVHPTFLVVAARAAVAFPGLDAAGIDIIARDLDQPAEGDNYIVCEVNNRPGISSHHFPVHGNPRDVARAIVDLHLGTNDVAIPDRPAGAEAQGSARSNLAADRLPPADEVAPGEIYDPSTHLIARELTHRGVNIRWLSRDSLIADVNGERLGYWGSSSHRTGRTGVRAATQPDVARRLLADAGVEIPQGRAFSNASDGTRARELAESLGAVTVTPVTNGGKGAVSGVRGADEFDRAWARAAGLARRRVLITQDFDGSDVRFLVVGGRCVAVSSSDDGRIVDLTDQTHPSFAEVAARAASTFPGLDVAEVSIVIRDITAPAEPGNHVVSAVHVRPDLRRYHFPHEGQPRDVAGAIIDLHVEVN